MKRQYLFVAVLVILGLLPGACVIEHHSDGFSHNGGKQTFEVYEENMRALLVFVDLAIRMDHYLAAPEDERPDAEQEYLPEYKIRSVGEGEWVGLRVRDTVFRVVTGGKALTDEGAEWKIYSVENVYVPSWATLIRTGEKKFALKVESCRTYQWTTEAELELQYKQDSLPDYYEDAEWSISGSGECVYNAEYDKVNQIVLQFEITRPLEKFAQSRHVADRGEVVMQVENLYLKQQEKIIATIENPDASDYRRVRILYKGKEYEY